MLGISIHNIYSSVKLSEFGDVAFIFPEVDLLIISKASSSAAQTGVPEVEKKAFLKNRRVLHVPDLKDINQLLKPDLHLLIVPRRLSNRFINYKEIKEELKAGKTIIISISGGDTTFTLKELENGVPVNIGVDEIIPPSAVAAVILFNLFSRQ